MKRIEEESAEESPSLRLANTVKKDCSKSSKQLANGCNLSTVRKRLNGMGDHVCRLNKVPRLNITIRKKRLAWATANKDWRSEDWKKVNFTYIFISM